MIKLHFIVAILFALVLSEESYCQNINPANNKVFVQNEVSIIKLTLNETDKQNLVFPDDPSIDQYYPAELHFKNSLIDTVLNPIGIRIRGNTSRASYKKSFKIDFKEYGGEQFYKLKKFNLKPNNNDPSFIREPLSWSVYTRMNVSAARTNFVELYMNNEFMGVYLNCENIDDEFVDRRYGNEAGNLYKCTWGADLSSSNDAYNDWNIELKTNEEENDRFGLIKFIDLLNAPQNDEWESEIEAIFNVDNYLRQLAVESMIGHWDGYSFNTNNYYLYEDSASGRIQFIPYDLDNTWGIDWIGYDWTTKDLNNWYNSTMNVPLTSQLLRIDAFKTKYVSYLKEVMAFWFDLEEEAVNNFELVKPLVEYDYYYTGSFGNNYDGFLASLYSPFANHVKYGVLDYMNKRYESAVVQVTAMKKNTFSYSDISLYPNPCNGQRITLKGKAEGFALFDIQGNKVIYTLSSNNEIIFKSKLAQGVYILRTHEKQVKFTVAY
ncbi:MAG: CotH kinase family protein [Prolixibacteraceae bacterium]|jgi:spore coat protein H|nr:CotH kinase family protein [Prolixibacteraceae bacterium]